MKWRISHGAVALAALGLLLTGEAHVDLLRLAGATVIVDGVLLSGDDDRRHLHILWGFAMGLTAKYDMCNTYVKDQEKYGFSILENLERILGRNSW